MPCPEFEPGFPQVNYCWTILIVGFGLGIVPVEDSS